MKNMTLDEWRTQAVEIKRAYQRHADFWASKEDADEWHKYLDDLEFDLVRKAVDRFIKTSQFPPTVADIRRNYDVARRERRDMLHRVRQELEMFEYKFPMGYDGRRADCEAEFARLTLDRADGDLELARKIGERVRLDAEEYLERGGAGRLIDWLRARK